VYKLVPSVVPESNFRVNAVGLGRELTDSNPVI
jgi:hypothetical protein